MISTDEWPELKGRHHAATMASLLRNSGERGRWSGAAERSVRVIGRTARGEFGKDAIVETPSGREDLIDVSIQISMREISKAADHTPQQRAIDCSPSAIICHLERLELAVAINRFRIKNGRTTLSR
jgi:hypothetical protein